MKVDELLGQQAGAAPPPAAPPPIAPPAPEPTGFPLRGPGEYGVWCCSVSLVAADDIARLRKYVQCNWLLGPNNHMPLKGGQVQALRPYEKYRLTAAKYNQTAQLQNTLRWEHSEKRDESLRKYLPGYDSVELDVRRKVLPALFPGVASCLGLHNGHILRQSYDTDGGSGFSRHIDEADDAEYPLYVSVAIKLTDDPADGGGTWMQVEGFQPVRYGSKAGSIVVFLSRRPHWSLRTPPKMGKVLKLVLFYKFVNPTLFAFYQRVAPPPLMHDTPDVKSGLPPQVPDGQTAEGGVAPAATPLQARPSPPPPRLLFPLSCFRALHADHTFAILTTPAWVAAGGSIAGGSRHLHQHRARSRPLPRASEDPLREQFAPLQGHSRRPLLCSAAGPASAS